MGIGTNYIIQGASNNPKTAVNVRSFVPWTSEAALIYYEVATSPNDLKYLGDTDSFFMRFKDGSGQVIFPITKNNLSLLSTATSSTHSSGHDAKYANDGDNTTYWGATAANNQWLQFDFSSAITLDTIKITEEVPNVTGFNIQYLSGGNMITLITGTTIHSQSFNFSEITTTRVRLNIVTANAAPQIEGMQLYRGLADSIYYKVSNGSLNIGVHGYYEDI
jgi:hypothetical protein